jgi:hypothetical protein
MNRYTSAPSGSNLYGELAPPVIFFELLGKI